METYPLEALLSVRHYREEGAKQNARSAEKALIEARAEADRKKLELETWRTWRIEEEDRRYDSIMGATMHLEDLDAFKAGLARLAAEEVARSQEMEDAVKKADSLSKELDKAREAVKNARKNAAKIETHKEIWTEETKKEAERQADLELEEFKPISRLGAEAEGEDR